MYFEHLLETVETVETVETDDTMCTFDRVVARPRCRTTALSHDRVIARSCYRVVV